MRTLPLVALTLTLTLAVFTGGCSLLPGIQSPEEVLTCEGVRVLWGLVCDGDVCAEQTRSAPACGAVELVDTGFELRVVPVEGLSLRQEGAETRVIPANGGDFTVPYPIGTVVSWVERARCR